MLRWAVDDSDSRRRGWAWAALIIWAVCGAAVIIPYFMLSKGGFTPVVVMTTLVYLLVGPVWSSALPLLSPARAELQGKVAMASGLALLAGPVASVLGMIVLGIFTDLNELPYRVLDGAILAAGLLGMLGTALLGLRDRKLASANAE